MVLAGAHWVLFICISDTPGCQEDEDEVKDVDLEAGLQRVSVGFSVQAQDALEIVFCVCVFVQFARLLPSFSCFCRVFTCCGFSTQITQILVALGGLTCLTFAEGVAVPCLGAMAGYYDLAGRHV